MKEYIESLTGAVLEIKRGNEVLLVGTAEIAEAMLSIQANQIAQAAETKHLRKMVQKNIDASITSHELAEFTATLNASKPMLGEASNNPIRKGTKLQKVWKHLKNYGGTDGMTSAGIRDAVGYESHP
ncbi:hypothetical protein CMI37_37520, partial [Candidatus Pacearchaeota archaeon]|nr:hypothetical protein [Candidatus Pacearchaeota archaeon]